MLTQKVHRSWPSLGESGTHDHRTLAEKAFLSLHEAILTGTLKPGERIPIEDLASALEMSPMPVREAVRRLDSLGLVENIPHKGARITELSIRDLYEIYEARLVLEPLAIYRAAQRFDEKDDERSKAAIAEMKNHRKDSVEIWHVHSKFHLGLYAAARSAWLLRLIQPLWESSERYRLAISHRSKGADRASPHELLLRYCREHDAGRAAFELYNHLVSTANSLAETLGSEVLFAPMEGDTWSVAPAGTDLSLALTDTP